MLTEALRSLVTRPDRRNSCKAAVEFFKPASNRGLPPSPPLSKLPMTEGESSRFGGVALGGGLPIPDCAASASGWGLSAGFGPEPSVLLAGRQWGTLAGETASRHWISSWRGVFL